MTRTVMNLVGLAVMVLAGCSLAQAPSTPGGQPAAVVPVVCAAPAGAVTDVATEPAWRQYADYRTWSMANGCIIRIDVIGDRPGPEHCGWEAARVIVTGIPVGARATDDRSDANYVRDPHNVFGDQVTASAFDPDAELPDGAVDTGFRQEGTALWVDRDDGLAIYLVMATVVERWPLDPDPALCM